MTYFLLEQGDEVVDYRLSNEDDIKFSLNHNHADFYLVDDGRVGNFGCESSLRSGLQQFLSFEREYDLNKHMERMC